MKAEKLELQCKRFVVWYFTNVTNFASLIDYFRNVNNFDIKVEARHLLLISFRLLLPVANDEMAEVPTLRLKIVIERNKKIKI